MKSRIILLITAAWIGCLYTAFATMQWPVTVENIAELKALHVADVINAETISTNIIPANAVSTRPAVYVKGYYNPGDRGGGIFEWDPNESAAPDDGRYIVTNGWGSGNGRWVRQFNGEVANVKMWGAKGDIVGSENATQMALAHDDTTNIQNAINGCFGTVCTELLFPSGWYKITDTLYFGDLIRLRGEKSRMCHIVMAYGNNKDILRSYIAQAALTSNTFNFDGGIRIEDLSLEFATESGSFFEPTGHNTTNSAIVICNPDEGTEIRNIQMLSGGYGIRCLGGGGPLALQDIVASHCAIAGIFIEPFPGSGLSGGTLSIIGLTGDHRWDESRSNACLVKLMDFAGVATIQDINAEGVYGGGIIHHRFPASLGGYDIGNLTIKNCIMNQGNSYSDLEGPHNFLVLESAGSRTAAVTMENIHLVGTTNLIQDLLSPRNVTAPDSSALGNHQAVVRLPLEYEAYNGGGVKPDGVTQDKYSRLVVGGQAIYSFVPPTTNAWYRILEPNSGSPFLSTKATVSSFGESSEFSANVLATADANAVELNVTRSMKANSWPFSPCVTKVRAGGYYDASGNVYPFTDIFVERAIPPLGFSDYNFYQITVACPVYDMPNVSANEGWVFLQTPTNALSSIVPAGCTLLQCVTNSLVR